MKIVSNIKSITGKIAAEVTDRAHHVKDALRTKVRANTGTKAGATVIDLSANPDDFRPALTHIVTTIEEARAANQKVIVMIGERHDTSAHFALSDMTRRALRKAGHKTRPALALEASHDFFEHAIMRWPDSMAPVRHGILNHLQTMKQERPEQYHKMQARAYASHAWMAAPITRVECVSAWLREQAPVRLVDLAFNRNNKFDMDVSETAEFIKNNRKPFNVFLNENTRQGSMRLRNEWMLANLQAMSRDHDITFLQTGLSHIAGDGKRGLPYKYSLHELAQNIDPSIKVITVLQEHKSEKFNYRRLPRPAQKAMNNRGTVIIRGGNEDLHFTGLHGTMKEEAASLRKIYSASGLPTRQFSIKNGKDCKQKRLELMPLEIK